MDPPVPVRRSNMCAVRSAISLDELEIERGELTKLTKRRGNTTLAKGIRPAEDKAGNKA